MAITKRAYRLLEAYMKAGEYVTRILEKKEKPSSMACSFPTSFELVVNGGAATKLGIPVPATIEGITVQVV